MVHARLGLGQFPRANGVWPRMDGRRLFPIRPIVDVVLLPRHRNVVAGTARALDGAGTPGVAAGRGRDSGAGPCLRRKHLRLSRPAQNHPATQLCDLSGQIRDARGVSDAVARGVRTGTIFPPLLRQRRRGPPVLRSRTAEGGGSGGRLFYNSNPLAPTLSPLGRSEGEDLFPSEFSNSKTFSNWRDFVRAPRGNLVLGVALPVSDG